MSVDHAGPLTRTVKDSARVLDVIGGPSDLDPRQRHLPSEVENGSFVEALESPFPGDGLAIGIVEEGFGIESPIESSHPDVDRTVRDTLAVFEQSLRQVRCRGTSIPMHGSGFDIWARIELEGAAALLRSEGVGQFVEGFYDTHLADFFAKARRTRADDFPPIYKLVVVLGQYLAEQYHGHYHARAQNLRRTLRSKYDEALSEVDLLAMPTTLTPAIEHRESTTRLEVFERHFNITNTCPFDVTGHPAISIPCGTVDNLPVGVMLIGRRFDDETVLRGAHLIERTIGWEPD